MNCKFSENDTVNDPLFSVNFISVSAEHTQVFSREIFSNGTRESVICMAVFTEQVLNGELHVT